MLNIEQLFFTYPKSDFTLRLDKFLVNQGEKIAIIGPSGIGKTTLLNLIAGIMLPESGSVMINDQHINQLSDQERRNFRVSTVGFIFQDFKLIEYLSVVDNILLPFRINKALTTNNSIRTHAKNLSSQLGIETHMHKKPGKLSQGEKQRVAICRALINDPQLILADEPTGNLDPDNKARIMEALITYSNENSTSLITVTHDHELLSYFDRTLDFQSLRHNHEK